MQQRSGSSNQERGQSDAADVNKQRQRGHYSSSEFLRVLRLDLPPSNKPGSHPRAALIRPSVGEQGHERPEHQQHRPEHDDQQRGDPEQPVQQRGQPVRRVHVDGERGGVQQTGGGGAVGGGVHRALLPGDAGGGGAVGVVHPVQRPPHSDRQPAAGADRPAGPGRRRRRRRGCGEQQSEPQRQGVHPGHPETRHVTPSGSAPYPSLHCDIIEKMSAVFSSRLSTFSLTCCQSSALARVQVQNTLLLVTATLHLSVCGNSLNVNQLRGVFVFTLNSEQTALLSPRSPSAFICTFLL